MGLFSAFQKVVKATVDTVILPVEVTKDLITGDFIFEETPDTCKRLEKIRERIQEAYDEIDD
jgi:phage shock protein A